MRPDARATAIVLAPLTAVMAMLVGSIAPAAAQSGCTVYQHRDYKGARWHLKPGDRLQVAGERCGSTQSHGTQRGRYHYQPSWNDQVSSFKVAPGCTIVLWQHAKGCGGGGSHFRANRSYTYVGSAWNDKTSFVECDCR